VFYVFFVSHSGRMTGIQFLTGGNGGIFSLHYQIQTSSGAHLASYPMVTRGFLPQSKAARA